MRIVHPLWVLLVCGMLTACGSGSGNSSAASPPQLSLQLEISPNNVTLPAGSSQQFTASLTNGSAAIVTWMVNGQTNGSSTVGTITPSGLYTAPMVPPLLEPVIVSACTSSTCDPIATTHVTVEFSNVSLNGQYIFTFDEIIGGSESRAVGTITVDSSGNVTGTEDVNSPSDMLTAISITGQYNLSADGQGVLTLSSNAGTLSMTLGLFAGANGGVLTDAVAGKIGSGHIYPVTATVNLLSSIQGNYLLSLGSGIMASADNSVGLLALSSGNIASGSLDENISGSNVQDNTVSGSYTVTGDNRGTLTMSAGSQTSHFAFYAVSADQLELLDMDTGTLKSGELDFQVNTQGSLSSSIFQFMGVGTGIMPDVLIATNALAIDSSGTGPCGNNPTFALYENDNGSYKTATGCFTYPAFTSGRSMITLATPFGNRNFVFYVQSSNPTNMLETSSGFGNLAGFAVPAQVAASVGGPAQYVLSVTGQSPNSKNLSTTQGILQIDFYGNVTGQVVRDVNGTISTTTVSGKLTPQNTAGYGDAAGIYVLTLNFGGGQSSSYFVAASSQGIASLMGTNATEVSSGSLDIQEEFTSQE